MRISEKDKDEKIVELYKSGLTFRQLQKRYHKSPNSIAKLVKGIEVKCAVCGKPRGKVRFHAHHPDRVNRPDYTIPLCPSCRAKEEARLRREKESTLRPLSGAALIKTENTASNISTDIPALLPRPLSPVGKKVATGLVAALVVEELFPGFFEKRWQEIKEHWEKH
jgi:hypothetical protein